MSRHETHRINPGSRSLVRTLRKLFPNVTREQFKELMNATEGYFDFEDLYERTTWREPFAIDAVLRSELRTCVEIAELHLAHASHGRDGEFYSMAAYYSYLSAEEVSKGLSSILSGQSCESLRGHRQGRKQYEPMASDQNRELLKALAPLLNSQRYDNALTTLDRVPEIIGFYEKAEHGFGVEMSAEFLRSTSNAFWNFGQSIVDVQFGEQELKRIVVQLKNVNAPDVYTPEFVVRIQNFLLRHVRMVADQMFLLLVLEPHKNVARYVENEVSPLNYTKTRSREAIQIGLLDCFDAIWRLQKRFIGDLRYMTESDT